MEYAIESEGYSSLIKYLSSQSYSKAIVLSDECISPLFGAELLQRLKVVLPTESIIIPSGEVTKSIEMATYCWKQLVANHVDRQSVLITLGGGVITDLGGFVAGCYMRGIDVVHIPTTLLGMVDSAIGGKCGINLEEGKNLIGIFHPAKFSFICLKYLDSLPQREFCSGMAEVIKYGVIYDPEFFSFIEDNIVAILQRKISLLTKIIERSCEIKKSIIKGDERDQKKQRAILNWGHTLGHAIETATKYQVFTHGEAISIGMNFAAHLSHALGLVDKSFIDRQATLLQKVSLPIHLPKTLKSQNLIELIKSDKKSTQKGISFIVARDFGNVFLMNPIDESLVLKTLEIF